MKVRLDKRISEQKATEIIELYLRGASLRHTAFCKGITTKELKWFLKTKGIPVRSKKEQWKAWKRWRDAPGSTVRYGAIYSNQYGNDWY